MKFKSLFGAGIVFIIFFARGAAATEEFQFVRCDNCFTETALRSAILNKIGSVKRCPYAEVDDCREPEHIETWFVYDRAAANAGASIDQFAHKFSVQRNEFYREVEREALTSSERNAFAELNIARTELLRGLGAWRDYWTAYLQSSVSLNKVNPEESICPGLSAFNSVFDYFSNPTLRVQLHDSINSNVRATTMWDRITSFSVGLTAGPFAINAGAEWTVNDRSVMLDIPGNRGRLMFNLHENQNGIVEGVLDLAFSIDADRERLNHYLYRDADGSYRFTNPKHIIDRCEGQELAQALVRLFPSSNFDAILNGNTPEPYCRPGNVNPGGTVTYTYTTYAFTRRPDGSPSYTTTEVTVTEEFDEYEERCND